jgi:hypothetical protein
MNPVFAPLNMSVLSTPRSTLDDPGAAGRDRIGTDYLTAPVVRHPSGLFQL